jgi:hypothetical protein
MKGLQVGGIAMQQWPTLACAAIHATFKPAADAEYQARVVMRTRESCGKRAQRRR